MKLSFLALAMVLSSAAFAQDAQKCFSISNNLDRKYCIDKHLEAVKSKLAAEKKAWGAEITGDAKEDKKEEIDNVIQSKKDNLSLVTSEIALYEKHLADVTALKESTPAVKAKKKKKKSKSPFGIKL